MPKAAQRPLRPGAGGTSGGAGLANAGRRAECFDLEKRHGRPMGALDHRAQQDLRCHADKSDTAGQGLRLELEPGCATALPFTKDIAAWTLPGWIFVRLQDASGQPVIDFTEVESGIFEGLRQGEGIYILQEPAAARSLANPWTR